LYYVLTFDRDKLEFLLQHDTHRGGYILEPCPLRSHYTGIEVNFADSLPPPKGWLAGALAALTRHVKPNYFSLT
jgi:hypothetical protein